MRPCKRVCLTSPGARPVRVRPCKHVCHPSAPPGARPARARARERLCQPPCRQEKETLTAQLDSLRLQTADVEALRQRAEAAEASAQEGRSSFKSL
eukprot:500735-Prymnesium_polylepis.2